MPAPRLAGGPDRSPTAGWLAGVLQRVTIRIAVWAGFLIVLALWTFTGLSIIRSLGDLEERAGAASQQYTEQEALLSRIENAVLVGGIYLRDAIIDANPAATPEYRRQLAAVRGVAEDAAAEYDAHVAGDSADPRFVDLRRVLTEYWIEAEQVASTIVPRTTAADSTALRMFVIPKRELIFQISQRIRELNRQTFETALRGRIADLYTELYQRAWFTIGVTGLVTLLVALLVIAHASRLERRIREQQVKDAETALVLHRLSANLVQAQEQERRTIARELHDAVGQALTAIRFELAAARRETPTEGAAARSLDEARAISEQALRDIRDLSQLLHPTVLDDLGLAAAVESLVNGFSRRTGLDIKLVCNWLSDRLPAELEVAVYRIVQEGLTNIVRHAEARHVHVTLSRQAETLAIAIEDDGRGFDASAAEGSPLRAGLGLVGIEERVRGFGGTLAVDSAIWRGTRLKIEIPVPRLESPVGQAG